MKKQQGRELQKKMDELQKKMDAMSDVERREHAMKVARLCVKDAAVLAAIVKSEESAIRILEEEKE
jgi:hypothetical protein